MSKLDDLIRQLSPEEIVYKPMGEFIRFLNGRAFKQQELLSDGKYRVLRVGNFHTNDKWYYSNLELEDDKYCECGDLLYTWAATIGPEIWKGKKVIYHYHIWKLKFDERVVDKQYLYHYLKMDTDNISKSLTNSTMPHVSMTSMNKRIVALPPLEVQREIVRILDNFTNLTAELVKELTARKTQYGYYRNKFLDFESSVSVKTIGDICDVVVGGEPPTDCIKGDVRDSTHIYPVWGNGKEVYGYSGTYKIDRDAVVISSIGANTGAVYYKEAFFTPIIRLKVILPKGNRINARFLFHALSGTTIKSKSSSVPNMNANEIKAIKIPVPPLDVQNRIVNVLDNFEKICSDLNIGLPAEIEARQKQYEYYRDKLLTFVETGNTILSRAEQSRAEQSRALIKLLQYVFGYAVVTLEDIAENCDSMRKPVTSGKREAGKHPYYGASGIVDYVKDYIFDGDYLLVSEDGANLLARSTPIAFSISGKNWVNNHAHVLKFDCYETRRFVEFYLNSIDLAPYISGGAQPKLNQKNLNRLEIPLPSQERQKYIVDILDRFDAICSDLTSGLPAEIEARQKQYEYYRDRLLSFKELN